jgi:HSP20 family protein
MNARQNHKALTVMHLRLFGKGSSFAPATWDANCGVPHHSHFARAGPAAVGASLTADAEKRVPNQRPAIAEKLSQVKTCECLWPYKPAVPIQQEDLDMVETAVKLSTKTEKTQAVGRPFASLRREIDRLFEDFDRDFWGFPWRRSAFDVEPLWRRELTVVASPAVDITESDKAYEITAELPGLDEKDIEVKLANGDLTIKGEKQEDKEQKTKDYYLRERHFGSFERYFRVPEGVDPNKIEATFNKGVLTVTLPKSPQAQKAEKKIEVKAAA